MKQLTTTSFSNSLVANSAARFSSQKSFWKFLLVFIIAFAALAAFSQGEETVCHTYFSNHHPVSKTKHTMYLVFQMSSILNPAYKVCFNFSTKKYDTLHLTTKDIIHDTTKSNGLFHFHEVGLLNHLNAIQPQSIFLLDNNFNLIAIDIIKEKDIKKLAETYEFPLPDDNHARKVHFYKLTGIAVAGVGNIKGQEIIVPNARMSCHDKRKYYQEHGINGQHAMLDF